MGSSYYNIEEMSRHIFHLLALVCIVGIELDDVIIFNPSNSQTCAGRSSPCVSALKSNGPQKRMLQWDDQSASTTECFDP
mmetsp:Transcript_15382/g.38769  ORF Transcript_15382/g.38769 Transcript_15382/m.38769 type:complete len:80 (-) Transcript_15382:646-885(-)